MNSDVIYKKVIPEFYTPMVSDITLQLYNKTCNKKTERKIQMLELKNIEKSFDNVNVLNHVNFSVSLETEIIPPITR